MSIQRTIISTTNAPAAVGPYSQAVRIGDLLYTAGQIPLDPATGSMVAPSIDVQTRQVLNNLSGLLEAADSDLGQVVKMTVFMTDLGQFQEMNAVYAEFFPDAPPARSAVEVSALPLGAMIEMEAVAVCG